MIVIVVPSNRPDKLQEFLANWQELARAHQAHIIVVEDGDNPRVRGYPLSSFPDEWSDVIFNHNDGVRNLGFLYVLNTFRKDLGTIITLDDDVSPPPGTDPIQDHLDALTEKYSFAWIPTCTPSPRGMPYGVREQQDCWVSHGVWNGIYDYDAPTQLVRGNPKPSFVVGGIPKGYLFPCCGMNLAFNALALPYLYFAPMGPEVGVHRFADIWMGFRLKRELDRLGKGIVTGFSVVNHDKASNVFRNLEQEAKGIRWNESIWKEPDQQPDDPEMKQYLSLWDEKYKLWQEIVFNLMEQ